MRHETPNRSLASKVAFLRRSEAYPGRPAAIDVHETHMSFVFLAPDTVYKLKKPVKLPYLDFSTLERREKACRAELAVNRRLAPDVYLGVAPLARAASGYAIGGDGETVDWLFGDNPWPDATEWVLPLIDGVGGVSMAAAHTHTGRATRRLLFPLPDAGNNHIVYR